MTVWPRFKDVSFPTPSSKFLDPALLPKYIDKVFPRGACMISQLMTCVWVSGIRGRGFFWFEGRSEKAVGARSLKDLCDQSLEAKTPHDMSWKGTTEICCR